MRKSIFSIVALLASYQVVACSGADSDSGIVDGASGGAPAVGSQSSGGAGSGVGAAPGSGGSGIGAGASGAGDGGGGGSGGDGTLAVGVGGSSAGGNDGAGLGAGGTGVDGAGGAPKGDGGSGGSDPLGGGGSGGTEACVVDHGGEEPALGEYYAQHFAIGAAIDSQYSSQESVLTKHFNSITAEDQMKFDALQPSEGNFSYGTADQIVNFATSNGMQVRGHALVWHRQTPAWVFSGSADQVLSRMKNHIESVMEHFSGKVKIWDVVNEAIMDDGLLRTNNEAEGQNSGWYGALGESYIAEAFIAARAADPDVKLFYNDYYNYHPVRRQAIFDLLSGLIDDGVPIDGVGLQTHLNLAPGTDPEEQSYHQTVKNLEEAIEMYSSLGLDVQITEVDLSLYLRGITYTSDMFYTPANVTSEIFDEQAARYREFFDMFRRQSDVISSVTFWGVSDDDTWLSEFDSGRQDFPLLFDAAKQPKAAFKALVDFCD